MQETKVVCDCCKKKMEEPNEVELIGKFIKDGNEVLGTDDEVVELVLEDLCSPCASALEDAVSDVIKRRELK